MVLSLIGGSIIRKLVTKTLTKALRSAVKNTGGDDHVRVDMSELLAVSHRLRDAGETGLRRELHKSVKDAVRPLTPLTRAEALQRLPKRGGLAAQVAREPQSVRVLTGKNPGVRLSVGKRRGGAAAADAGLVRHPTFGDRAKWVAQPVRPGWFTDTVEKNRPQTVRAVRQAVDRTAEEITRRLPKG